MTPEQLVRIANTPEPTAQAWAPVLTAACALYGIDTPLRQAAFLGQCAVESARFTTLVENLNYAAEALVRIWPLHFTQTLAQQYGRTADHAANQPMIANIAYASRMGNGDAASGDGWTYRGRGIVQDTGKAQYARLSYELNLPLLEHPELLEQPSAAARAAGAFWRDRNLNLLADQKAYTALTHVVNGGTMGLDERVVITERGLVVLKEPS
jgi:putative chitinase